jgi:hypothetical protein
MLHGTVNKTSNNEDKETVRMTADWVQTYSSVEAMAKDTEYIIIGKLIDSYVWEYPKEYKHVPLLFTYYKVEVLSEIKGEMENVISVYVDGGVQNGKEYIIEDSPLLNVGDTMILFLMNGSNEDYTTVGGPQGRFKVIDGIVYATDEYEGKYNTLTAHLKTNKMKLEDFINKIS